MWLVTGRTSIARMAITVLALVVMRAGIGPVLAQTGGERTTISGTLTAIAPAVDVLVRTTADQMVTLTLTGDSIDPQLYVLDSVGQIVAQNDDNDTSLWLPSAQDAAIQFIPLVSDLMVVRVTSYRWLDAGPYTLTLEGVEVLEQTVVDILQSASGTLVEGSLVARSDRAAHLAYAFYGTAGQQVTLTLSSDQFDTVLEIYDSAGNLITGNDDHNRETFDLMGDTDSALVVEVPEDGLYAALVRSFEEEGVGRFILTIDGANFGISTSVPEDQRPEFGVCDDVLGSVVSVSSAFGGNFVADNLLDDNPTTGWSSRGGDTAPYIIFEVATGATVWLDGVVFNGFSSSPGFVNDSVQAFQIGVATTLVNPGAFEIVLEAQFPLENAPRSYTFTPREGRYVLLRPLTNYGGGYFQATEFNACTSLTGVGSEITGNPPYFINGQLGGSEPFAEYRLFAQENASLTVTVVSEVFDPVVEVYGENGRLLADNDDHGAGFSLPSLWDSGLSLSIDDPGMITIRVRSFARGGLFRLTAEGTGIQAQPPDVPLLPPCRDVSSINVGGEVVDYSSEFAGRWLADYLIDGSAETGWASAPGTQRARPEFVIIDLTGGIHTIDSFRINPSATGGDTSEFNVSRFAVLVSTTNSDQDSFTEVFSTLLTERYRYMLSFDLPQPVQARYVMLETRDTFGGRWHEVAEFTVCGAN